MGDFRAQPLFDSIKAIVGSPAGAPVSSEALGAPEALGFYARLVARVRGELTTARAGVPYQSAGTRLLTQELGKLDRLFAEHRRAISELALSADTDTSTLKWI